MELFGAVLVLVGSAWVLLAGVGLHRFDSVFARMHAAGKATTFGLGLILLGSALRTFDLGATAKLAVVGLLAILTIPAGVHLIARAAFRAGTELSAGTAIDAHTAERLDRHRRSPE